MKVQLIVVQGKPEGKHIPLVGPVFKIGRGETCHLRPNSERVSREHAEFTVTADRVTVRDLGSRNGTLVNGRALNQPYVLKDHDLVQVGPLTFEVSFQEDVAVQASAGAAPSLPSVGAHAIPELESLVEGASASASARGSETIMIPAFLSGTVPRPASPIAASDVDDAEYERHPVADGDTVLDVPVVQHAESPKRAKPGEKKVSSAASEILRKMMERGRASR